LCPVVEESLAPGHRFDARTAVAAGAALLLFALPLLALVFGAFRSSAPGTPGEWTAAGLTRVLRSGATWRAAGASALLAFCAAAAGTVLATVFAWLGARTSTPLRRLLTPVMVLTFAVPPLFYALGWRLLPVASWWGLALVLALRVAAVSYLLLLGPMGRVDASYDDASRVAGASRVQALLTIDLPVLGPTLLAGAVLGLAMSWGALGTPLVFGTGTVLATRAYEAAPADYPGAAILAVLLVLAVLVLLAVRHRARRFVPAAGRARVRLGRWGWLAGAAIALYAGLALALPVGRLLWASFHTSTGPAMANYRTVLAHPAPLWASIWTGVVAGVLGTVLAVGFGLAVRRSASRLRRVPEMALSLALATPGLAVALGVLTLVRAVPGLGRLYGTQAANLVALVTPIAGQATATAVGRLSREMEEAARVCGASASRALTGIRLRLMLPSCAVACLVTAIVAAGNLDVPALMSTSDTPSVPLVALGDYRAGATGTAAASACLLLAFVLALLLLGGFAIAMLRARAGTGRVPTVDPVEVRHG
jgi:iron(III) transport system permease protein